MAAPLVRFTTVSLDGYIADADGGFDWTEPSAEVHRFINELMRPATRHLLGRRDYEVMRYWDTLDLDEVSEVEREWARYWAPVDKVVYSRTLDRVESPGAVLRSAFDVDEIRAWKAASATPIYIGGSSLASEAARADLLDELQVIVAPCIVGAGTQLFADDVSLRLELREERRFANGSVFVSYGVLR